MISGHGVDHQHMARQERHVRCPRVLYAFLYIHQVRGREVQTILKGFTLAIDRPGTGGEAGPVLGQAQPHLKEEVSAPVD